MALVVQAPAARLLEKAQHIEIVLTDAYGARVWRRSDYSQDIIGALIFFASAESDFITGQTLLVDGGSVMH